MQGFGSKVTVLGPGWLWAEMGEMQGVGQWPPMAVVTPEMACSCLILTPRRQGLCLAHRRHPGTQQVLWTRLLSVLSLQKAPQILFEPSPFSLPSHRWGGH